MLFSVFFWQALAVFDVDADQKLDRADFAHFINQFCNACGADFNTLAEFLILLAALEDNPGEELAFLVRHLECSRALPYTYITSICTRHMDIGNNCTAEKLSSS